MPQCRVALEAPEAPGWPELTVPDPDSVRKLIWLMLTDCAAVKPVLVNCKLAVTVVPDCKTLDTWPLKLGAPTGPGSGDGR